MLHIPLRKLDELKPRQTDLDHFETATTDELRAWQRDRLLWSLRHAYENVPHYRAKFNLAGLGLGIKPFGSRRMHSEIGVSTNTSMNSPAGTSVRTMSSSAR